MGSGKNKAENRHPPESSPQAVTLDFRVLAPYEMGAFVLALLAYPSEEDEESRGRLLRTLCHLYLRAQAEEDQIWSCTLQLIKPIYAFVNPKDVSRDLRTFKRRLRDRMVAARMALAYLKSQVEGENFSYPNGLNAISLNQLSEWVMSDLDATDETNIESRIWRPARPVLHIAVATALAIDQSERSGPRPINFGHFLAHPALVRHLVDQAAQIAELIRANKSIPVDANALIPVRCVG
jgi:hypothetical protein